MAFFILGWKDASIGKVLALQDSAQDKYVKSISPELLKKERLSYTLPTWAGSMSLP